MSVRLVAIALGALFGFAISWGQLIDPDRIRAMLLLEDSYLYVMMAVAVAVGFVGVHALRRIGARALVTGEPVSWTTSAVERRHVVGAAIFGIGWAVTDACPAPIAGQLAQGTLWSLFTIAGVAIGIMLFLRGEERATSPAARERGAPTGSRADVLAG